MGQNTGLVSFRRRSDIFVDKTNSSKPGILTVNSVLSFENNRNELIVQNFFRYNCASILTAIFTLILFEVWDIRFFWLFR